MVLPHQQNVLIDDNLQILVDDLRRTKDKVPSKGSVYRQAIIAEHARLCPNIHPEVREQAILNEELIEKHGKSKKTKESK